MEVERDDEAAQEERDNQEEEEDDEGEDTASVKTYIKSIIAFDDDDDKRYPNATSSPKGNIQLCFISLSNVMLASMKYNPFYLSKLQLFAYYYCNPNPLQMSRHRNGFN